MRVLTTILIASFLIFALPSVAADPTYEVPNPADVAGAATTFTDSVNATRDTFRDAAFENAGDAFDDVTGPDGPTFPGDRLENIAGAAGDAGSGVVNAAAAFRGAVATYAAERVENKTSEASATIDSGLDVAVAAIGAGDAIGDAFVRAVCNDPLVNSLGPEGTCGDDSIVSTTGSTADAVRDDLTSEAGQSEDRADRAVQAALTFLSNFADFPSSS